MNKANLKSYAPKARLDFIKAVTERANVLGISAAVVVPAEVRGDIALIDGREWPAKLAGQRDDLIARIQRHGFEQTMDEVAYTWFNRFAALRYMEIHDYLGHGWRVLSSRDGGLPEILRHASELTLPGLHPNRAREMQLAGNQDNALYKLLLVAQCNELSRVMPFLFERIDDETELLLPENLLRTDSIVAKLVDQVPEEDWQEIEVIGWLYQFYISEKKDQVIGKVVKSEDIPAATQLFTPNWIVQYLVQNSVGRLWLMANPSSTLASQWPYYIQPAVQTPEVQAQLDALIQTRIREDGETLNPETITVLDPACGSGHILVVAYDVLKAIYLERGYQLRSIPRLILEKNLYGLDIDDRAAQLAAFALLMKARADDWRLFNEPPTLNVLSLQESKGLDVDELATHLGPFGIQRAPLKTLLDTFEHAKTIGSLIQVPAGLNGQLAAMISGLQQALQVGDLYVRQAAKDLLPLVWRATVLGMQFDAVVANPPYMGNGGMNAGVKDFAATEFPSAKSDLFACFIERGYTLTKAAGHNAMVTMQSWMFLSSFQAMRERLLREKSILTMAHFGPGGFDHASAMIVQTTAFVLIKGSLGRNFKPTFFRLLSGGEKEKQAALVSGQNRYDAITQDGFARIPGSPIAYWATTKLIQAFESNPRLSSKLVTAQGMKTLDNERFVRDWQEVSSRTLGGPAGYGTSAPKWFPINHGGEYRRWYGNNESVLNWEGDGAEIKSLAIEKYNSITRTVTAMGHYFRAGITWTSISSNFGVRHFPDGFLFTNAGMCAFGDEGLVKIGGCLLNSSAARRFLEFMSPTVNYGPNQVKELPFPALVDSTACHRVSDALVELARQDWDCYEGSWDFKRPPIVASANPEQTLESSYSSWVKTNVATIATAKCLEEENNRIFIDAYGLVDELTSEVSCEQITLLVNPRFRYGGKLLQDELWQRFREDTMQELISYAIGCALGRYSLDEPGLMYSHTGNIGFDPRRYEKKFPADADGILSTTDERWFAEDAASRVREFLRAVWGADALDKNIGWLAESLGMKSSRGGSETPDEALRRYLADRFFKDHVQTYKKRPIYWLFSSGKQGAFQALVYLHRYNEGTLARMRAEYVVPLIAKMASRLDMLDKDIAAASSAAARTKLQKQIEALRKKQIELLAYDEKLRHYADMRIALDLDDGVKVNYAKFGDLVAESKAITGGADE